MVKSNELIETNSTIENRVSNGSNVISLIKTLKLLKKTNNSTKYHQECVLLEDLVCKKIEEDENFIQTNIYTQSLEVLKEEYDLYESNKRITYMRPIKKKLRNEEYYTELISYLKISKNDRIDSYVKQALEKNIVIKPKKIKKAEFYYEPCSVGSRLNYKKDLIGGGMLLDKQKMSDFASTFVKACEKYNLLPSVKLRIGIKEPNPNEFIDILKKSGIKKVYIHARLLSQGYYRPAEYSTLKDVKDIEIIVNGDIVDKDSLNYAISSTKCSGAMIGREALVNPSIFSILKDTNQLKKKEIILRFLDYATDLRLDIIKQNLSKMTRRVVNGGEIRHEMNNLKTIDEIKEIINASDKLS